MCGFGGNTGAGIGEFELVLLLGGGGGLNGGPDIEFEAGLDAGAGGGIGECTCGDCCLCIGGE